MASLRKLAWSNVKILAGTALGIATAKVRQLSVDFLILRFTAGPGAAYSVFDECRSWRQALKNLGALIAEELEWQIVFRDKAGDWWYRTYPGKAPPAP